jgi:hypothetical protein
MSKCPGYPFYGFQHSDETVQPAEDVAGIGMYFKVTQEFPAYISRVLLVKALSDYSPGQFMLKTTTEWSFLTLTGEEFHLHV